MYTWSKLSKAPQAKTKHGHEMAIELVSRADFWYKIRCASRPSRWRGPRAPGNTFNLFYFCLSGFLCCLGGHVPYNRKIRHAGHTLATQPKPQNTNCEPNGYKAQQFGLQKGPL